MLYEVITHRFNLGLMCVLVAGVVLLSAQALWVDNYARWHERTEGEATEVDKTVIERLADPLTHMIRNAVDHGLEAPEKRRAAGKPSEGMITLSAQHRSGRVVIEVSDDGAGINRPKVRQIAIDKGLIPPESVLSDTET